MPLGRPRRPARSASRRPTPPTRSPRWSPTSHRSATGRRSPTSTSPAATWPTAASCSAANCAACHSAAGAGGALSYGQAAPVAATRPRRTQVGAAMRSGPGQMPVFGPDVIGDEELDDLVALRRVPRRTPTTAAGCRSAGSARSPRASWPGCSASGLLLASLDRRWTWIGRPAMPTTRRGRRRWRGRPTERRDDRADAERRGPARADAARPRRRGRSVAFGRQHRPAPSALAVVYWRGGQPQLEGVLLALVARRHRRRHRHRGPSTFMPHDQVAEERHPIASTEEEVDGLPPRTSSGARASLARRRLLVRLRRRRRRRARRGAAVPHPLARPPAGQGPQGRRRTAGGVSGSSPSDGEPVRADDLAVDGVITVFPEGHTDAADAAHAAHPHPTRDQRLHAPARAARTGPSTASSPTRSCAPTSAARSGSTRPTSGLLLCPCHQSTFDVLDGARPVFGPAARSLPQLPLASTPTATWSPRRLLRPRRPRLLGPGPVTAGR